VTNINLTFDQNAANVLPQGTLVSGSYKPADYRAAGYNFPGPAQPGPYASPNLNNFSNSAPNGTWSLYVADFTPPDGGFINGGWSVAIITQPVIDGLASVTNNENVTVRQNITVEDDSPVTPTYTWAGVSSDQTVVANSNIVVTGSGTNYTLTLTPTANAFGTTTNTIFGTNAYGQVVSATFVTKFNFVNQPPFILPVPLPSQVVSAGGVASIPLNYGDHGFTQDKLTVTFASSDNNLIPLSNIKLVGTNILLAPAGNQTGTASITVTVTQPPAGGLSTNASFRVTVLASPTPLGANTNLITINNVAPATPYPSTINISGVAGNVVNVTATLVGVQHPFPSDISALLVGPQGQKVVLMSFAGDGNPVSNLRVTLDDNAASFLPQGQLTDGTFKPTDYKITDSYAAPAPPPPYSRVLSAFAGTNPNGTWSLYVQDDANPDGGLIAGGWLLNIVTTSPIIQGVGPQTTPENTPLSVPIVVSSAVTAVTNLTVTSSHANDAPPGLVSTLQVNGTGTNRTLVITPGANLPSAVQTGDGTSLITVNVIDGSTTSTIQFPLTVTYVNQPPSITGLNDQSTPANQLLSINFVVNDPDDPIDSIVVGADTADHSIGTVAVAGTGGTRKLTFTPTGVTGNTLVSVSASDALNTNTVTFKVTVTTASGPVLQPIPPQSTVVNVSAVVPLSVSAGLTPLNALSYSATATGSNPNLITGVSFNVAGTNVTATIRVAQDQIGSSQVTITVADANLATSSQTFTLSVTPRPPTLANIPDQSTAVGVPVTIRLGITAGDVSISNLNFSATSTPLGSSPQLVSGVDFTFDGVNEFATIKVFPGVAGSNNVSILVYDGFSTVSDSFVLTVRAPVAPVLGPIADQTTAQNTPVTVPLSVTSPDTAITNLSFSASSTNLDLIQAVDFKYSGGVESATVTVKSNVTGVAWITISVTDGINPASSQTFKLTIGSSVQPTMTITLVGNQLTIIVSGAPNASYEVQSTTDFATWTNVASITADATGVAHYTATISGTGLLFYRVQVK
jgi:subtilisin-like proprotein convertase family protein